MTSPEKIPFLSTILLFESIPDNLVDCAGFVPKISLAPLCFEHVYYCTLSFVLV